MVLLVESTLNALSTSCKKYFKYFLQKVLQVLLELNNIFSKTNFSQFKNVSKQTLTWYKKGWLVAFVKDKQKEEGNIGLASKNKGRSMIIMIVQAPVLYIM